MSDIFDRETQEIHDLITEVGRLHDKMHRWFMRRPDEPTTYFSSDTTPPIGWTIVSVSDNGSVLCQSPTGERRRYVFEPTHRNEFICERCSLRQDARPKVEPEF